MRYIKLLSSSDQAIGNAGIFVSFGELQTRMFPIGSSSRPLVLPILALVALAPTLQAQNLAIIGVRLIDPRRSAESTTILVRDGKIAEVSSSASVPEGFTRVDGKGMFCYPGFIDAYSTVGIRSPEAPTAGTRPSATSSAPASMWAKNRTGIRARVDAGANLNLAEVLSEAHQSGFTSSLIAPFSGLARGQAVWVPLNDSATRPRAFAMTFSFRGAGGGGGYPGTTMASYALLRQTMYDARNPSMVGSGTTLDPDLFALAPQSIANGRALFALDTDIDLFRAIRFCEEFGLKLAVAGGKDAFRRAEWLAETKTPIMVSISIGDEPSVEATAIGPPQEILVERRQVWRERAENVVKLHQAGVEFALSSDGDGYDGFLSNLRRIVALGLPKDAAIRALTETPARIFGLSSELGGVEIGMRAHLTLFSGDMFDEKSTVKHIVVDGKLFSYGQGGPR